MRNVYKILIRMSKGRKWLGRPEGSRECNIKVDVKEIDGEGVDRVDLTLLRNRRLNPVTPTVFHRLGGEFNCVLFCPASRYSVRASHVFTALGTNG
jgi:hypothetical protein